MLFDIVTRFSLNAILLIELFCINNTVASSFSETFSNVIVLDVITNGFPYELYYTSVLIGNNLS